jgi:hypothetical protein
MTDFQSAFDANTSGINTTLTTQLSSVQQWANIPGSLVKASSSAAGYLWGFNSANQAWVCQQPCTGQWTQVDLSKLGTTGAQSVSSILDIATDDTNVYLLFSAGNTTSLATKTANNQTEWTLTPVKNPNFAPVNIFSTHTYLWIQSATNQKVKIPKPVNMTNSMPVADVSVKITSASSSALYGVDSTGKAMKSDETLQTGWAPVSGLAGTAVKSLIGDLDQSGLFMIDNNSNLAECSGDCSAKHIVPVNTQGHLPLYVTADPGTKQLWMTSGTPGNVGNIFNRIAQPDYSSVTTALNPLDQKRDNIVTGITAEYNKQTEVMTLNKQISDFQDLFAKLFGEATKATQDTNTQIAKVQSDVDAQTSSLKHVTDAEATIRKLVITLAVAALVYAVFSFLGWVVHVIVLVILGVGIYLSLNNDINFPSLRT